MHLHIFSATFKHTWLPSSAPVDGIAYSFMENRRKCMQAANSAFLNPLASISKSLPHDGWLDVVSSPSILWWSSSPVLTSGHYCSNCAKPSTESSVSCVYGLLHHSLLPITGLICFNFFCVTFLWPSNFSAPLTEQLSQMFFLTHFSWSLASLLPQIYQVFVSTTFQCHMWPLSWLCHQPMFSAQYFGPVAALDITNPCGFTR